METPEILIMLFVFYIIFAAILISLGVMIKSEIKQRLSNKKKVEKDGK